MGGYDNKYDTRSVLRLFARNSLETRGLACLIVLHIVSSLVLINIHLFQPYFQDTPTTSITETMQKERRMSRRGLTEDQFYQILSDKYVLTTEKLRENGYPYVMRCEDGQKRVKIDVADEKTLFTEDNGLFLRSSSELIISV